MDERMRVVEDFSPSFRKKTIRQLQVVGEMTAKIQTETISASRLIIRHILRFYDSAVPALILASP